MLCIHCYHFRSTTFVFRLPELIFSFEDALSLLLFEKPVNPETTQPYNFFVSSIRIRSIGSLNEAFYFSVMSNRGQKRSRSRGRGNYHQQQRDRKRHATPDSSGSDFDYYELPVPKGKDWDAPRWHPLSPFYGMSGTQEREYLIDMKHKHRREMAKKTRKVEFLPRRSTLESYDSQEENSVLGRNKPSANKKSNFSDQIGHKKFFKQGHRAKRASIKLQGVLKEFKSQGREFTSIHCESDLQRTAWYRLKLKAKTNQEKMCRNKLLEVEEKCEEQKRKLERYEMLFGKLPDEEGNGKEDDACVQEKKDNEKDEEKDDAAAEASELLEALKTNDVQPRNDEELVQEIIEHDLEGEFAE